MIDGESELAKTLKAKIKEQQRSAMATRSRSSSRCSTSTKRRRCFAEASDAREIYNASRAKVIKLAADPKTMREAVELYTGDSADLMEPYIAALRKLKTLQQEDLRQAPAKKARRPTAARAMSSCAIIGAAVIFGIVLAILLARSIVRPLSNAMSIAESIKDGRLDNSIDVSGSDETGEAARIARRHADRIARAR